VKIFPQGKNNKNKEKQAEKKRNFLFLSDNLT
jgi:hypothetical protein